MQRYYPKPTVCGIKEHMFKTIKNTPWLLTWVFFIAFAGQAVRNLIDWLGYGILIILTVALFTYHTTKTHSSQQSPKIPLTLKILGTILVISTIFSSYLLWSLLGVAITSVTFYIAWLICKYYRWKEIKIALWFSLLGILILSFLFEIVVALIGQPLLPIPLMHVENPPGLYYWSIGQIFTGGPIQGILGNRNLLGFIAVLFLIITVFNSQISKRAKISSIGLSVLTILLTSSATITVIVINSIVITGVVYLMKIWKTKYQRTKYVVLTFFTGLTVTFIIVFYHPLVALLGRDPDMTDRFTIWKTVFNLALQKPFTGYGWLGHWVPTVDPYQNLIVFGGVTHLHAHNAYLDVLLQTGIFGLLFLAILIIISGIKVWKIAVDGNSFKTIIPLLLYVALLVQGITESRLLLEGNLLLFLIITLYVQKENQAVMSMVDEVKNKLTVT